ncbi:predicted protein [Naegleria gruberi]|uniref:Predicted protein n=1 Tax=Naegleria gruberi TaxID=5762 RepID=D2W4X9_NAEGR|nr:uncharacterized protein NAEGRDRAFT_76467 [Naegleria gruberi]EFC35874.1 predicted protein [Naegleria gruberi]|eukprot:XP_002668618.1 predicted protein [Naegleria gruberi strain NEG-M]
MYNNWTSSPTSALPSLFNISSSPTANSPTLSNNVSDEIFHSIYTARAAICDQDLETLKSLKLHLIINNNSVLGETILMTAVKESAHEIIELLTQVPNIDFNVVCNYC